MESLAKHPRLIRRGTVYHFRAKVPRDLVDHYEKREITFSLKTRDPREAVQLVRIESVKLDQEFADARRRSAAEPATTLSNLDIQRLAAVFHQRLLEEDDELRFAAAGEKDPYALVKEQVELAGGVAPFSGSDDPSHDGMTTREYLKAVETTDLLLEDFKQALARGNVSVVSNQVDELLAENFIKIDDRSPAYRQLSREILKTWVKTLELVERRQRGEVIETPPAPPTDRTAPQAGTRTLSQVFHQWTAEKRGISPKTVTEFEAQVRRFIDLHGDLDICDITRTHMREFKDAMLRYPSRLPKALARLPVRELIERAERDASLKPLSPRTVNEKCIAALSAVLGWADYQGYRDGNPAANLKVDLGRVREDRRIPYSIDDLNLIFRFPIYTEHERPKGGGGDAAKWLPLLALFTGARLEELGQLKVEDIKQTDGITFIDMTVVDAGSRLKSNASRRRVPIHPELIECGFLQYVRARRESNDSMLFPELKSNRLQRTAAFSQWWGRYARKHGITDRRKVFHSFRHTTKDAFRECEVPWEIMEAIQGHAIQGEGPKYGKGYSIKRMAAEMAKLKFVGLDINHLKTNATTEDQERNLR